MATQKGRIIDKAGNEFRFDNVDVFDAIETTDPAHAKEVGACYDKSKLGISFDPKLIDYDLLKLDWILTTIKLQGIDFMYVNENNVILSTKHYQPKTITYSLHTYTDYETKEPVMSCSMGLWL